MDVRNRVDRADVVDNALVVASCVLETVRLDELVEDEVLEDVEDEDEELVLEDVWDDDEVDVR